MPISDDQSPADSGAAILYGSMLPRQGTRQKVELEAARQQAASALEDIEALAEVYLGALNVAGKALSFHTWHKKAGSISGAETRRWSEFRRIRDQLLDAGLIADAAPDDFWVNNKAQRWELTLQGQMAAQLLIEKYSGWDSIRT